MTGRQLKAGYFALTAMNTLAASYFFNYLFFLLRDRYGFGDEQNLWVSAVYGFIYIFSAWQCGKFAQRRGFRTSLKVGFTGVLVLMIAGLFADSIPALMALLAVYSVVLLFTWPALEAIVSANESRAGMQHMVGIYNCTWSAAAAVAYFTGGALYQRFGKGSVFGIPALIVALQLVLLFWLETKTPAGPVVAGPAPGPAPPAPEIPKGSVGPRGFLKMAWLANPFAYVAMSTVIAVMPGIAQKLALSPAKVGLFCSIWLFGRFAAFAGLWHWDGWHYRFRWLLLSFFTLIGSFALMLVATQLWLVMVAQLFFGLATGLIYYSSLYYSMDIGEASAEHGGLHEAAIGAGLFAGPALGAAALRFLPGTPFSAVAGVSGLLLAGLGALLWIWRRERQFSRQAAA
ncbi:MAG: MFS transporter [Verrucomicrobiota bacterium]